MILPGVRYEQTNTFYNAFFGRVPQLDTDIDADQVVLRDTTSEQSYGDWFPMVQLRVRPTNWFDVRLAYTRNAVAPGFPRHVATGANQRHQPDSSAKALPVCARLRLRTSTPTCPSTLTALDSFSVGGFYKRIEGVIYNADIRLQNQEVADANGFSDLVGYRILEPRNLDTPTMVRGIEVDWQANLLWLPGPLSGITFNANVSRIFSDTEVERVRSTTETGPPPFFLPTVTFSTVRQEVRLLDQPDWVANVSLGYDRGPFSGRASVLYQEGNLTGYGSNDRTLSFFDTYVRWDAQASYRIIPALQLFAQLNNLTNRPDLALQSTGRFLAEEESYGRSFNLGLRFRP